MEQIALAVGIDSAEDSPPQLPPHRRHHGDRASHARAVILDTLLARALAESDYAAKRERFRRENPHSAVKRGMGLAAFYHGAGFTGSGERYLNSLAGIDVPLRQGPRARRQH
jgi:xanthine dehydrogenase molybdopterin-binding subunit B